MSDGELRAIFRKHLRGFDLQAIEIGAAGSGVPDLNGCKNGTEFWVENKACDHWRCKIRPMQIGWAERRMHVGGRVFCAVRRADTELWLYHGDMMRRLSEERLDVVPSLGHWTGGAARWNWVAIEEWLIHRSFTPFT